MSADERLRLEQQVIRLKEELERVEAQKDIECDRAYLNGMRTGSILADMPDEWNAVWETRHKQILDASRALKLSS